MKNTKKKYQTLKPNIFKRQLTSGLSWTMLRAEVLGVIYAIFALKICFCTSDNSKDGKLLSRPATFHFPEYAYKETSKNVS